MEIVPLSDVPQFIDWQWRAFGEAINREFFASVVNSGLNGADFR